jgi:hypothetical protein
MALQLGPTFVTSDVSGLIGALALKHSRRLRLLLPRLQQAFLENTNSWVHKEGKSLAHIVEAKEVEQRWFYSPRLNAVSFPPVPEVGNGFL